MNKIDLYSLGFTEKEADVYMALNTYGAAPASILARLTQIKRTSMYDILNSLLEKNLITSYKKGIYTYFAIDDINKILYQEREKVRLAESVVSQLKRQYGRSNNIEVQHYKGYEGYREIYEEILRTNPKELMVWIHLDNFQSALDPVREEEWTQERIDKKIWTRLLMQDTPLARKFQKKDDESCRKTILVPKENMFQSTCILYSDHILFFDSQKEIIGLHIHHSEFYQLLKQSFEMSWNLFAGSSSV